MNEGNQSLFEIRKAREGEIIQETFIACKNNDDLPLKRHRLENILF